MKRKLSIGAAFIGNSKWVLFFFFFFIHFCTKWIDQLQNSNPGRTYSGSRSLLSTINLGHSSKI
jgi:hypothetical protein